MRGVIVASEFVPAQSSGLLLAQVGHPTATPTAKATPKATSTAKETPKATPAPHPSGTPRSRSAVTVIVPNGQLNVTIGGAKKGQTATPQPATPTPRPATPTPAATASATPGTIFTPTLNEQVVAWTWTVVLVIAALAAVIFGLRYLNFVFGKATSPQSAAAQVPDPDERLARRRRNTVVIFVLIGMVVVGLLWIPMVPDLNAQRWIPLEFAAVGILFSGGLFGFLFGLPKLNDSGSNANANANGNANATAVDAGAPARTGVYRPSTNLEEVVERIATLLAGVALAQLIALPGYIASFANFISAGLGGGTIQSASVLATGIILYFAPLGFVLSYLCTKTIIAPEISSVDEALVGFRRNKVVVDDFPILPDVKPDPTPDEQSAALKIIAHPLSSLTTASQKATWGRAQMMLEHYAEAVDAFAQAQALDSNNKNILTDYAQALYQKDDSNAAYALRLAQQAEPLAQNDYELLARIRNVQAVLFLYIPGGYEAAIKTVNATLRDARLPTGTTLRYYRACGFGQMWRAIDEQNPKPAIAAAQKHAIARKILLDTELSLAYPDMLEKFELVIGLRPRADDSHDDDLQAFARSPEAAPFCRVLGVDQAKIQPPRPSPVPLPLPKEDPLAIIARSRKIR